MHTKQQPLEAHGKYKIDSSSIVLQITRKMASFPILLIFESQTKLLWLAISTMLT